MIIGKIGILRSGFRKCSFERVFMVRGIVTIRGGIASSLLQAQPWECRGLIVIVVSNS